MKNAKRDQSVDPEKLDDNGLIGDDLEKIVGGSGVADQGAASQGRGHLHHDESGHAPDCVPPACT